MSFYAMMISRSRLLEEDHGHFHREIPRLAIKKAPAWSSCYLSSNTTDLILVCAEQECS
jgi:hypothetical protein